MTKKIIFTIIGVFSFLMTSAQLKKDIEYVKENAYYFEINQSSIVGKGADILKKSIKESQFFILGEQHFSAKISEFTNAIIPILSKEKYRYFVAEIGPNSARKITTLIKEQSSLFDFNTEIYNLVGEIPIPFFDGKEDETFLKTALNNEFEIWGIDQEYLTSQVFLIDDIYNLSNNKKEIKKSYKNVKDYLIIETKKEITNSKYNLFTQLLNSKEVNHFFDSIDSTNTKSQKIILDLKNSWEVYRLREVKDYYTSLHKRLNIMQTNFINYYTKASKEGALPKAIIKIGGKHASKGKSLDNVCDIGNFVMELANFNQMRSTNVLVIPSAFFNDDKTIENNIDKEDEIWLRSILNEAQEKWVIIDLKNIEKISWKHKIESESLKDYMYRFDYLIITPISEFTSLNHKK